MSTISFKVTSRTTGEHHKPGASWKCSCWALLGLLVLSSPSIGQEMAPRVGPYTPPGYGGAQQPNGPSAITSPQLSFDDPEPPLDPRIQAMLRSDQKLEVVHHRSQLVITKHKVRRMAWSDPSVIDVVQFSETELSLLGLGLGTTDLWLWFEDQEAPLMYSVSVVRDPSLENQRRLDYGRIERKLALLYPNSKVYLIPLTRKIIVRGQARDPQEAARIMQVVRTEVIAQERFTGGLYGNGANGYGAGYGGGAGGYGGGDDLANGNNNGFNNLLNSIIVDELEVPGEFTINIRVRMAEINRSQLRRLGVDWNAAINNGQVVLSQAAGFAANPVLTGIFDAGDFSVVIDALASNGSVRVLEDTRLSVLAGHSASFIAGGEFAVPTIVGIGGVGGQQTSFRGFGTSVIVTPTVVDDDLIRMQIVPELSSVNGSNSVNGIPGTNVRRVQTFVEMREGQTIVLGGLFSRQENAENVRIPFLGEIPIVGQYVFNSKRATEDESELLIIVTPEIVRAMDPDQVPPLPGWYATHPDDIDFYRNNRIEGNPDLGHYQLLPYGNGQGVGEDVGYNFFNPAPQGGPIQPGRYGDGMTYPQDNQQYPNGGGPIQMMPQQYYGQPGPTPTPAYPNGLGQQRVPMNPTIQRTSGAYPTNSPAGSTYRR
ncbi:MAG: pilus assembly protein N-terminal domain-containing protein [Planctomycetaceae bacterium]